MYRLILFLLMVALLPGCGGGGGGSSSTTSTDPTPSNSAPVATAGLDRTVFTGQSVRLDGRQSQDSDGDALAFEWMLPEGTSGAELEDAQTPQPTFTSTRPGSYPVLLRVGDNQAISEDTIILTAVSPFNPTPPSDSPNTGDPAPSDPTGPSPSDPADPSPSDPTDPSAPSPSPSDPGTSFTNYDVTRIQGSFDGIAHSMQGLENGGVVILGSVQSEAGDKNGALTVVAADGSVKAVREFGGAGDESPSTVVPLSSQEFLVCGTSDSREPGNDDLFWAKIRTDLNVNPVLSYFDSGGQDFDSSCTATAAGGVLLAGSAASSSVPQGEMLFVAVDSADQPTRLLAGESTAGYGVAALETPAGNILVGNLREGSTWDIRAFGIEDQGNWQKTFGAAGTEKAQGAILAGNGDILIYGSTDSYGSDYDLYLVRLDPAGTPIWDPGAKDGVVIGAAGIEFVNSLQETSDGGIILAGGAETETGDYDATLLKLDTAGNVQWSEYLGQGEDDVSIFVSPAPVGGYNLAGLGGGTLDFISPGDFKFSGYFWLIRSNESGNVAPASIPIPPVSAQEGTALTLDLSTFFTDVNREDSQAISISPELPAGLSLDANGLLEGMLPQGSGGQTFNLTVTTTDGELSTSQNMTLSVSKASN